MKKVLIVNQGLSANIGDKAILLALTKYFGSRGYQVSIQGFTHYYETKIDDIDYKQYRQTRKFDLPILLKWNLKAKTADCRAKRTSVPYSADSLRHN